MALPNYKQIAMNMPSGSSPSHMMSPGPAGYHNILKERLRPSGSSGDRGKDNSSPFLHSSHGNPAFTPQKMGKGGAVVDPRAPKPPKAPEKPLMPFMRYSRKVWDQVKTANPELKLWEVSKIIAQMWKEAPDTERQEFIDEYEAEKIQYVEALKVHHATPEYGAWNRYHVNRLKAGVDSEEPVSRSSSKNQERRLDIQPAEDEDDQDDGYTFKHVAYARFLRNHRLINEIFSDAIVPDVRSVVTTQRMQVLKRQVQSLTMHQMKLETELQQIEEKFEAKKRKFVESSDFFQEELKKHCKPAVDDDTFKKMVERQCEVLRRERQRQLEEPKVQQPPTPKPEETSAGAPSAPNTTIRPNEVDKPDSAEQVLQPMEVDGSEGSAPAPAATPASSSAEDNKPSPSAQETAASPAAVAVSEKKAETIPVESPIPASVAAVANQPSPAPTTPGPVATPSPAESVQPASEENTSENMDIEPPVEPSTATHHPSTASTHPPQTTTTTNTITTASDISSPHPAYVAPPQSIPPPAQPQALPQQPHQIPGPLPHLQTAAPIPGAPIPVAPVGPVTGATPPPVQQQQPPLVGAPHPPPPVHASHPPPHVMPPVDPNAPPHHMAAHIPPPGMHHEGQPMPPQAPYGAPGYGHPAQGPPGAVRPPYYPPYQYHPYPPPHQQYGPPAHYMPMHPPPHGPPGPAGPGPVPPQQQPMPANPPPRTEEAEEGKSAESEAPKKE